MGISCGLFCKGNSNFNFDRKEINMQSEKEKATNANKSWRKSMSEFLALNTHAKIYSCKGFNIRNGKTTGGQKQTCCAKKNENSY